MGAHESLARRAEPSCCPVVEHDFTQIGIERDRVHQERSSLGPAAVAVSAGLCGLV